MSEVMDMGEEKQGKPSQKIGNSDHGFGRLFIAELRSLLLP